MKNSIRHCRYVLAVLAALQVQGQPDHVPGEVERGTVSANTAAIPVQQLESDFYDWHVRHQQVLEHIAKQPVDLLFIGDSITHMFGGLPTSPIARGRETWDTYYGHRNAINMGFGWDRTQNVLWRLTNGELKGLSPKVAVILIGTNNRTATANARQNTPAEIGEAMENICTVLHARAPACKILLLGVLPRSPSHFVEPIREINTLFATLGEREYVTFLDMHSQFADASGLPRKELMHDGVHPNAAGYRLWAETMEAVLSQLLGDEAVRPRQNTRMAPLH